MTQCIQYFVHEMNRPFCFARKYKLASAFREHKANLLVFFVKGVTVFHCFVTQKAFYPRKKVCKKFGAPFDSRQYCWHRSANCWLWYSGPIPDHGMKGPGGQTSQRGEHWHRYGIWVSGVLSLIEVPNCGIIPKERALGDENDLLATRHFPWKKSLRLWKILLRLKGAERSSNRARSAITEIWWLLRHMWAK